MTRCARVVLTATMTVVTMAGLATTATAMVSSGHGKSGIKCNRVLSDLIRLNVPILSPGSSDVC
ncbi:hypothetical protein [Actinomadura miaoliensis]|uniref:Chaplin n=1 Tax=Actinomadura miaoliensis TaxID=430685 RepID=A0ABP7V186_9ACTN